MLCDAYYFLIGPYTRHAPEALLRIMRASIRINSDADFVIVVNDDIGHLSQDQRKRTVCGELEFPDNVRMVTITESMNEIKQALRQNIEDIKNKKHPLTSRERKQRIRYLQGPIFIIDSFEAMMNEHKDAIMRSHRYLCGIKDTFQTMLSLRPYNGRSLLVSDADVCLLNIKTLTDYAVDIAGTFKEADGKKVLSGSLYRTWYYNAEQLCVIKPGVEVSGIYSGVQDQILKFTFPKFLDGSFDEYLKSAGAPTRARHRNTAALGEIGARLFVNENEDLMPYKTSDDTVLEKGDVACMTFLDNKFSFPIRIGADKKREVEPKCRDHYQWLKTHHRVIGRGCYISSGFCPYGTKFLSPYMCDGIELYTFLMHARAFLCDILLMKAVIDCNSGAEVTVTQEELRDLYRYLYSVVESLSVCDKLADNSRVAEKRESGREYEYNERQLLIVSKTVKSLADREMSSAVEKERGKSVNDGAASGVSSDMMLVASPDPVAAGKSIGNN